MSFLLDTNVVSEWMNPSPNPGVVRWLTHVDEDGVFISVVTLREFRYGIERRAMGKRSSDLERLLQGDLLLRFEGRILGVNEAVAGYRRWTRILPLRQLFID